MFAYIVHWEALAVRNDNVAMLEAHLREAGRLLYGPDRAGAAVVTAPEPAADASVQSLIAPHADTLPARVDGQLLTAEQHAQLRGSMTGQLLLRQVSNATKHHAALRAIAEGGGADDEWRLVVEDDAFTVQTPEVLARALAQAPATVDVMMLGMPTNNAAVQGGHPLLEHHYPVVLPHCDSYAVRVAAARSMAAAFMPVRFPTQVQLWWLTRTLGLRLHMASPNQFVDGSKFGTFLSSIEVNNRVWLNIHYCELEALLRAAEASSPPDSAALTALAASAARIQNRGHPDVQHLLARAEVLAGRPEAALTLYEAALGMYEREGSPMNERSRFLLDHMAVYGIRAAVGA